VPGLAHQWKTIRVIDRLDGKIDIEVRPVEVIRRRQGDVDELADRSVAEPGKLRKGYETLAVRQQQPESVNRNVRHFNFRSDRSAYVG
jgi:hypothetical protein